MRAAKGDCFEVRIERAFPFGLQVDCFFSGAAAAGHVFQKTLSGKGFGLNADDLFAQVVNQDVPVQGFDAAGFEDQGGRLIMRDGFKSEGLAVAGNITGRGGHREKNNRRNGYDCCESIHAGIIG